MTTRDEWGMHRVPAFTQELWNEARTLTMFRLKMTAPEVPEGVWEKLIERGDKQVYAAIIEIAVELARTRNMIIVSVACMRKCEYLAELQYVRAKLKSVA